METGDSALPIKAGSQYVCAGDCAHTRTASSENRGRHTSEGMERILQSLSMQRPLHLPQATTEKTVRQPPDSNLPSPAMQVTPDCSPRGAYMKSNQRLLARQSDTCSHTMTYPSDFKLLTRPPRPCRRTSATRPDLRYGLWLLPDG